MNDEQICESCNRAIPPVSPAGLCPHCAFGGLEEKAGDIPGVELGELIGEGAFGKVYEGLQLDYSLRRVAVKVSREGDVSGQLRERFLAEMQILALMDHANIARLITSGTTTDGRPFYVMEYVEGVQLDEFLMVTDLSQAEILKLMRALCGAVAHAHQQGVVHRDLKASNVLMCHKTQEPKIIDFGIARVLSGPLEMALGGTQEERIGTPRYMSPEQLEGDPQIDTRTDIYALGLIFHELLTGRPVLGDVVRNDVSWTENAQRVREFTFPKLTTYGAPKEWDWVLARACASNREDRYASAFEFSCDLKALATGGLVTAGQKSALYLLRKALRRHWVAAAFALLILVAVGAVAVVKSRVAQVERDARRDLESSLAQVQAAEERARKEASDAKLSEGMLAHRAGEYEGARASLRAALDIWPQNGDARYALNFLQSTTSFAKRVKTWKSEIEITSVEAEEHGFLLRGRRGETKGVETRRLKGAWPINDVEVTDRGGVLRFRSKASGVALMSPLRYGTGRERATVSLRSGHALVVKAGNVCELWDISRLRPSVRTQKLSSPAVFAGFKNGSDKLLMVDLTGNLLTWRTGKEVSSLALMDLPVVVAETKREELTLLHDYWWSYGQGHFQGYSGGFRDMMAIGHTLYVTKYRGRDLLGVLNARENPNGLLATRGGKLGVKTESGIYQPVEPMGQGDFDTLMIMADDVGATGALLERDGDVTVVNLVTAEVTSQFSTLPQVQFGALLDGGAVIVVVDAAGKMQAFDTATGARWGSKVAISQGGRDAEVVRIVPVPGKNEVLVTMQGDLQIRRYDVLSGEELTRGMVHEREVFWFGCLPGGQIAVSVDQSMTQASESAFRVWSLRTGRELVPTLDFDCHIMWPSIADEGRRIAISLVDGEVSRWDIEE